MILCVSEGTCCICFIKPTTGSVPHLSRELELVLADTGGGVGYTLGKLPVHHRADT